MTSLVFCTLLSLQQSTTNIDPQIARVIAAIRAVDNHAHPVLPPPADTTDRNFDALPVDNMEPATDPVAWRPDNPQLTGAWKALWNFTEPAPLDDAGMKRLAAARSKVKAREGLRYDNWILDRSDIGVMIANRVTLGPGVAPPRFRWVPYADALLFPFDTSVLAAETPDKKLFFAMEDRLRAQYLEAAGLQSAPATLDDYLAKMLIPTLRRQHSEGAVAVKFELAYLRSLAITNPSLKDAQLIYRKFANGEIREPTDYRSLQDFLFRAIALECGRLEMAVQIHCMSGGGSYFDIAGGNPLLLEPLFNDSSLRSTKFILLHGGWPFVREAGALLQKPNVFLDFSQQSLTLQPRTMSGWLREWLETFPDKVLYGTDGYPFSPQLGWEEATWIANHNAREALGMALTGMLRDGEITRVRASEIAAMVLQGSAERLYRIK